MQPHRLYQRLRQDIERILRHFPGNGQLPLCPRGDERRLAGPQGNRGSREIFEFRYDGHAYSPRRRVTFFGPRTCCGYPLYPLDVCRAGLQHCRLLLRRPVHRTGNFPGLHARTRETRPVHPGRGRHFLRHPGPGPAGRLPHAARR